MRFTALYMLLLLAVFPSAAQATALSDLANSMQPGTWAELSTNGLTTSLLRTDNPEEGLKPQSILQYADSASWDSVTNQFMFVGSPHQRYYKFIAYRESNNTWRSVNDPLPGIPFSTKLIGHGYDHNTADTVTGEIFYRAQNTNDFYRYNTTTETWAALPQLTINGGIYKVAGGIAYSQELGGLLFFEARLNGDVYLWTRSSNSWSHVGSANIGTDAFHGIAEYSKAHRLALVGGGNTVTAMWKVDSGGNLTQFKNAPQSFGIGQSITSVDPVSGNYLFFFDNGNFYEFNPVTDTWSLRGTCSGSPCATMPFWEPGGTSNDGVWDVVQAPIPEYGVVMFLKYNDNAGDGVPRVFLYKHT